MNHLLWLWFVAGFVFNYKYLLLINDPQVAKNKVALISIGIFSAFASFTGLLMAFPYVLTRLAVAQEHRA
jgi:hypothetical protein